MPNLPATKQSSIRNHYLERLRELLSHYHKAKGSEASKRKFHLDGFMEAGLVARLFTRKEINRLVDEEHRKFFGLSTQERYDRLQKIEKATREHDWSSFDDPAFTRRGPRASDP